MRSFRCGNLAEGVLSKEFPPPGVVEDWAAWLRTENDDDAVRIRSTSRTGRPCGGADFLTQLEALVGRSLHPRKRGRKPKRPPHDDAPEKDGADKPIS